MRRIRSGDTEVVDGHNSIQFEIGHDKLSKATDILFVDGDPTREYTELAAGQLAICMAASTEDMPTVDLLADRLQSLQENNNPDKSPTDANFFTVDEALTERERAFLDASRVVVGLMYQAARYTS
jgi:hypothetical protein